MVARCDLFGATAPDIPGAHLAQPMIEQLTRSSAAQFGLKPELCLFCHAAQRLNADP